MSWQDVRSFYEDPEPFEDDFRTLSESTPKARRAHTCDECGGLIAAGEKYRKFVGINEGHFEITKYHLSGARCIEGEKQRAEWESIQNDIMGDIMTEAYVRAHSVLCGLCDGWRFDLYDMVGDFCTACGGAGQWDAGEVFPEAFDTETTEPRLPATLWNLFVPSKPRQKPPEPAVAYDADNLPF
jgi:hypothetical protein